MSLFNDHIALLLIVSALSSLAESVAIGENYKIHIENGLQWNVLTMHCTLNKKTDMGTFKLEVNTETFFYVMEDSACTVVSCNLSWGTGLRHGRVFDAFRSADPLLKKCKGSECLWKAKDDGIYLYDSATTKYVLVHKWCKLQYNASATISSCPN